MLMSVSVLLRQRPGMLVADEVPLVPGMRAAGSARHAPPGRKLVHVNNLDKVALLVLPAVHFSMVIWPSRVLPSEDPYPPRTSRRAIGPHPASVAVASSGMPRLAVVGGAGDGAVLLVHRAPPAGRLFTYDGELASALRSRSLAVRSFDSRVLCFAAQVVAVA